MGRVEQIYCTHCTAETSDFGRFAGFSARAGSLEPGPLREVYETLRGLASYDLPTDMPPAQAVRASAATAPVRLVVYPSLGRLSAVGQVCYRPAPGGEGMGAYFAHILFAPRGPSAPEWSALDGLRLWGAPGWVHEDRPEIPHRLPSLPGLDALRLGEPPTIDEEVFLTFLTAPAGGPFYDPGGVIPGRWRGAGAEHRRGLFERLLAGSIIPDPSPRGAVTLVAEPGLAALLFFGLLRTTPRWVFGAELSISTYDPGRPSAMLAATTFHDPSAADLPPDAYRGPGFALNTFHPDRLTRPTRPGAAFAREVVALLAGRGGWDALDAMRSEFESAPPIGPGALDELTEVRQTLDALFDPARGPVTWRWRAGSVGDRFGAKVAQERFRKVVLAPEGLRGLADSPNVPTILDLLMRGPSAADLAPALAAMAGAGSFSPHLRSAEIPRRERVRAMLDQVHREGRFPADLEVALYDHLAGRPSHLDGPVAEVVPDVLDRLRPEVLEPLYERAPEHARTGLLASVMKRLAAHPSAGVVLRDLVGRQDEESFGRLAEVVPEALQVLHADDPAPLDARARHLLRALTADPRRLAARLDALSSIAPSLDPRLARQVSAWQEVRDRIAEVAGSSGRGRPGGRLRALFGRKPPESPLAEALRALGTALASVVPETTTVEDRCRLIAGLAGPDADGLSPEDWEAIRRSLRPVARA